MDMKRKTGLILALDVLSRKRAIELTASLGECFDAIKIGYPLILAAGLEIVSEVSKQAFVIADLKIADIPNTDRLICEQVLGAGAGGVIAHAFTGSDSLRACADCAGRFGADLFVVTEMSHPGAREFMGPAAADMARLAVECGAAGVVAPATRPDRIKMIRSIVGQRLIISPGVGAQGGSAKSAILAGADYIIVGRSILDADDPEAKARELLSQML